MSAAVTVMGPTMEGPPLVDVPELVAVAASTLRPSPQWVETSLVALQNDDSASGGADQTPPAGATARVWGDGPEMKEGATSSLLRCCSKKLSFS